VELGGDGAAGAWFAAGPAVAEQVEPGSELGSDLFGQVNELFVQPDGQRVRSVVVQNSDGFQDIDDVRERHVAGCELPNGAGLDRLAASVNGSQDSQSPLGERQGARVPAAPVSQA
jgi:hypothetical protein